MTFVKSIFWNKPEARLRAGWRLAIQIALNIGLAVLIVRLITYFVGPVVSQSLWSDVLNYAALLGVTLFSVWFAGRFLDRRYFSDFGMHLNHRAWWADFAFGLALGSGPLVGLVLVALAAGRVTLEPAFVSGIPGVSFVMAVLFSAGVYVCVGIFEELARAYHVRNLLEGSNVRWLGLEGAMTVAIVGASLVSVLMHGGDMTFLLFVFVSAAVNALCYLLTGRIAIATAYHVAWDFVVATVFGFGAQDTGTTTAFFIIRFGDLVRVDDNGISPILSGIAIGLELVGLLLILGWVRLHYGKVKLHEKLAVPNLLPRKND